MSIYFCRVGRHIKIGHSFDPCGRTVAYWFSAYVPDEVYRQRGKVAPEMLWVATGTWADERRIHAVLAEHRIEGEWFADCQPVRDFITAYGKPEPDDPYFGPCGCGAHDSTLDAHPPVDCDDHADYDRWVAA